MNGSPKDIALKLLDALMAKDQTRMFEILAEDAVLFDPHYPQPLMKGHAEIKAGNDFAFGLLKKMHWTVLRSWESGDSAVLEVDTDHEMVNGMMLTPKQVFVVDVKDGRITRWQSFVPYPPPAG